jgi:antitoxin component HigA of HigAB toxin-antitoxin module
VLAAFIESYEARHWAIEAPDPVSAIKETMEQRHLGQSDLARLLGSRSRASELAPRSGHRAGQARQLVAVSELQRGAFPEVLSFAEWFS